MGKENMKFSSENFNFVNTDCIKISNTNETFKLKAFQHKTLGFINQE